MALNLPELSVEFRLAAALALPVMGDNATAAPRLLAEVTEAQLLPLLNQHGVMPTVAANLQALLGSEKAKALFPGVLEKAAESQQLAVRQALLQLQLGRLMQAKGLKHHFFKGPKLAALLYGQAALREAKDLDLWVPAAHFMAVHELLRAQGFDSYQRLQGMSARTWQLFRYGHKDCQYFNRQGLVLELHNRFTASHRQLNQALAASFDQSEQAQAQLMFIYLCWHGAHSLFHRLKWLLDIHLYIEHFDYDHEPERLLELAKPLHMTRSMVVAWVLRCHVFDCPLPAAVAELWQGDPVARRIVSQCLHLYANPHKARGLAYSYNKNRHELMLAEGWSEKKELLKRRFAPGLKEFRIAPALPPALYCLYYLMRPFTYVSAALYLRFFAPRHKRKLHPKQ